ncbi:hypothetical protein HanHA89_Chr08g0278841 [Helianthus annuus]|nr:hypothetical protein HanHA89_Chr08g0278841 [Helianthus annuus]
MDPSDVRTKLNPGGGIGPVIQTATPVSLTAFTAFSGCPTTFYHPCTQSRNKYIFFMSSLEALKMLDRPTTLFVQ